jgi:hypothetical protein
VDVENMENREEIIPRDFFRICKWKDLFGEADLVGNFTNHCKRNSAVRRLAVLRDVDEAQNRNARCWEGPASPLAGFLAANTTLAANVTCRTWRVLTFIVPRRVLFSKFSLRGTLKFSFHA